MGGGDHTDMDDAVRRTGGGGGGSERPGVVRRQRTVEKFASDSRFQVLCLLLSTGEFKAQIRRVDNWRLLKHEQTDEPHNC